MGQLFPTVLSLCSVNVFLTKALTAERQNSTVKTPVGFGSMMCQEEALTFPTHPTLLEGESLTVDNLCKTAFNALS